VGQSQLLDSVVESVPVVLVVLVPTVGSVVTVASVDVDVVETSVVAEATEVLPVPSLPPSISRRQIWPSPQVSPASQVMLP
jgi:hypothetical protein